MSVDLYDAKPEDVVRFRREERKRERQAVSFQTEREKQLRREADALERRMNIKPMGVTLATNSGGSRCR